MSKKEFMLFSGTSHLALAEAIARSLGMGLSRVFIDKFPDGEIGVQILENVRGRDVFVIQSIANHPNFYLMELLIMIDALKRASAHRIVAVIPYYGYARQDRKDKGRVPITAKLVADLLQAAGASRVMTMDLHAEQIQGFFDIPVDNLYARPALIAGIKKWNIKTPVIVTPDIGSIKLARILAHELNANFALVDKQRISGRSIDVHALIGDVQGREVILVDDICATGQTLKKAVNACLTSGALHVFGAITHYLMDQDGWIQESGMKKLLITDTIAHAKQIERPHIEEISVASIFGMGIQSIIKNQSISAFFRPQS